MMINTMGVVCNDTVLHVINMQYESCCLQMAAYLLWVFGLLLLKQSPKWQNDY